MADHNAESALRRPEAERRPYREVLRTHEALPGLARWCTCGHMATTIYDRESHVIEALLDLSTPPASTSEEGNR